MTLSTASRRSSRTYQTTAVKGRGTRANVLGLLLLAIDPYGLPPFKTTELERSYGLVDFDAPPAEHGEVASTATRSPSTTLCSSVLGAAGSSCATASTPKASCGASRNVRQGATWNGPSEEWPAFERWRGGAAILR